MNTKFFLTILRFQYIKVYLHFAYTLEDQTCWKKGDIIQVDNQKMSTDA